MTKGCWLTKDERTAILKACQKENCTRGELARKMGITYFQLYNALNERTRCGLKPYAKIVDYLEMNNG